MSSNMSFITRRKKSDWIDCLTSADLQLVGHDLARLPNLPSVNWILHRHWRPPVGNSTGREPVEPLPMAQHLAVEHPSEHMDGPWVNMICPKAYFKVG